MNNIFIPATVGQVETLADINARNEATSQLMATAAGREELSVSMVDPLREMRDYRAVGRRAFRIYPLGQGAIPEFPKDIEVPAYVIGEEGEEVQAKVKGKKVLVPLFKITANPMIPLTEIKQARFDLNDRVREKVKSEIVKVEDGKIFDLMRIVADRSTDINAITTVKESELTVKHFSKAQAEIEKWGELDAVSIYMNPFWKQVLREMNNVQTGYYIDFETSRELITAGYIARLNGTQINTSSMVPKDMIFITCEPEYFGRLVVSWDLTVLEAEDNKALEVGYSIFEEIGLLIHNPKGLSAIKIQVGL